MQPTMKCCGLPLASIFLLVTPVHACCPQDFLDAEIAEDRAAHREAKASKRPKTTTDAGFPVVTTAMSVGPVEPAEGAMIDYRILSRPFFIIGYDATSIRWLKNNRETLVEHQAIGLVVNVANREQMNALRGVAGSDIPLHATPGDRLAEHFGIRHYPFYIDRDGAIR